MSASQIGVFLIEVGFVFGVTLALMTLYAWKLGGGMFSNTKYLYTAIAIAVAVAVIRVILFNERKAGRAFI